MGNPPRAGRANGGYGSSLLDQLAEWRFYYLRLAEMSVGQSVRQPDEC
jgi:hypothetical protein